MTTTCKLEIGNDIQDKATLLECYKLTESGAYNYKDNNVHSLKNWDTDTTDSDYVYNYGEVGNQFYAKAADGTELTATSNDHYFNKIKLYVSGNEKIEDIVKRKTSMSSDKIRISPLKTNK